MKKPGNPNIRQYHFRTDRQEPLKSPSISVRFTTSTYEALQGMADVREFIRTAVEEKLKRERAEQGKE